VRRLILTEYSPSVDPVELSLDQRDFLQRALPSIAIAPARGRLDAYVLTPGSTIGVARIGELTVEIRPKLAIERVMFLIGYAIDRGSWSEETTELAHASLVEAIAPAFIAHTRRAFRRGLLQGYRTEEDALTTIRGRIRFDDQIRRRLGSYPPVEVRFDEFTEDFEPNRLIKAALHQLSRLTRSHGTTRALRGLEHALERVELIRYTPTAIPAVTYNRHNEHYRAAVELARLILVGSAFELRQGAVRATAFTIDMNKVFENFVVTALRDSLRLDRRSFPQGSTGHKLHLDQARHVRLRPDISWWQRERCVFVGDVKYKRVALAGYEHPDLYQLLAYATAANLPGGILIYAHGEHPESAYSVRHCDRELRVLALSLAGQPDEILAQIDAVAAEVKSLRSRAAAAE
jgi:5-methylcytosine-specific restriction enzyme subunit McrC